MVEVEQELQVGQVVHPDVVQRLFTSIDALADYIKTFQIVQGGFTQAFVQDKGFCFILEYPRREQD